MSTNELLAKCRRFAKSMNAWSTQELKLLNIGPKQAGLLRFVSKNNGCSASDLSKFTLTDPAATGRALDALVKKKWVTRKEHPYDRRLWVLRITALGKRQLPVLDRISIKMEKKLDKYLSPQERDKLQELLEKLTANISESLSK